MGVLTLVYVHRGSGLCVAVHEWFQSRRQDCLFWFLSSVVEDSPQRSYVTASPAWLGTCGAPPPLSACCYPQTLLTVKITGALTMVKLVLNTHNGSSPQTGAYTINILNEICTFYKLWTTYPRINNLPRDFISLSFTADLVLSPGFLPLA